VLNNHVTPPLAHRAAHPRGAWDIQAWVAELVGSGLSAGHVRKIHGVLSGILGLAVRDRRLPSNPALGGDLPRGRERPRRYLSAAQVEQLAATAGHGRLPELVLAYCALRWSELAALRVARLDLLRRRLTVADAMTEVNGGRIVWGRVEVTRIALRPDPLAAGRRTRHPPDRQEPRGPRLYDRERGHPCATATPAATGSTWRLQRSASRD
jgi:integrase